MTHSKVGSGQFTSPRVMPSHTKLDVEWFMGLKLLRADVVDGGSFTIADLMEINHQCIPTLRNYKEIKKCEHAPKGHMSL